MTTSTEESPPPTGLTSLPWFDALAAAKLQTRLKAISEADEQRRKSLDEEMLEGTELTTALGWFGIFPEYTPFGNYYEADGEIGLHLHGDSYPRLTERLDGDRRLVTFRLEIEHIPDKKALFSGPYKNFIAVVDQPADSDWTSLRAQMCDLVEELWQDANRDLRTEAIHKEEREKRLQDYPVYRVISGAMSSAGMQDELNKLWEAGYNVAQIVQGYHADGVAGSPKIIFKRRTTDQDYELP